MGNNDNISVSEWYDNLIQEMYEKYHEDSKLATPLKERTETQSETTGIATSKIQKESTPKED